MRRISSCVDKQNSMTRVRQFLKWNIVKFNVYYRTINGLSQTNRISFSLYACSCCCCWSISIFFKHLRAKVTLFRYWTSSTRPKPPTPKVPMRLRSLSCTWLNSVFATNDFETRENVASMIFELRISSRLPRWASKALEGNDIDSGQLSSVLLNLFTFCRASNSLLLAS